MSECFRKLYIFNDEVRNCSEFDSSILYSGESMYEVIKVSDGVPIFLDDHLNRLFQTAGLKSRELWLDRKLVSISVYRILKLNNIDFGNIKIVFNFPTPLNNSGNFLIYFLEHHYPTLIQEEYGVSSILFFAERDYPSAKIINLHLRSAIFKRLIDTHSYEALLVDKERYINEGSRSNVFFTRNGELYTAPDGDVLSGIARKYVLEACKSVGIRVHFSKVHVDNITDFEGVFISGTSPGVIPLSSIGDTNFDPHCAVIKVIRENYQQIIESHIIRVKD